MSEGAQAGSIGRVVVWLDTASENGAAIETATRLAAHANAPLHGVYVEDEDLLHLAKLPFARQFTLGAGAERLTLELVELHLRVAAEQARRALAAAAERQGVAHSFEVARASGAAVISASETDLVVAGGLTRPVDRHFRLECRCWSTLEVNPGPFLVVGHAASADGDVVILLRDRDPASERLLDAAVQIAQANGSGLTVICPPELAAAGFEDWLGARLAGHRVPLQIEVGPAEPLALHRRIGELRCRLLAVGAGFTEVAGAGLREVAERLACDILVVR